MKVVLLTSDSLRHKYIAAQLSEQLELGLVITETKSESITDTSQLNKEDTTFIKQHFEKRSRNETDFFGKYQSFPKVVSLMKIPHGSVNTEVVKSAIDKAEADYLVLFGSSIITDPLLKDYEGRIINLHLGLSPYYRGSATNLFPYYYNEPECIGASIHLATSVVDEGAVLHQVRPEIKPTEDLHSIGNKTILEAGKVLPKVIKAYAEQKITPQKQSGTGKICRNKDLDPAVLREIYSKFETGIIVNYLKNKNARDNAKPVISQF